MIYNGPWYNLVSLRYLLHFVSEVEGSFGCRSKRNPTKLPATRVVGVAKNVGEYWITSFLRQALSGMRKKCDKQLPKSNVHSKTQELFYLQKLNELSLPFRR
jgi:hypothetical protein